MAINLLDLIKGQLTGPLLSSLADTIGAEQGAAQRALDGAVPTLLASLVKQGSSNAGAEALAASLDKFDSGFLGDLGSMFTAGKHKLMLDLGGGLLKNLLGGSSGAVTDLLGKLSGLGNAKTGSLLSLLAPIVFGVLSKQKKSLGLGASGLQKLLSDQKQFLAGLLPAGVGDALGVTKLLSTTDGSRTQAPSRAAGRSMLGKLIPLALIVALGYFAYTNYSSSKDSTLASENVLLSSGLVGGLSAEFDAIDAALASISDPVSAERAVPRLTTASLHLTALSAQFDELPSATKDSVRAVIRDYTAKLQDRAHDLIELQGVQPVLQPVLDPVLVQLRAF